MNGGLWQECFDDLYDSYCANGLTAEQAAHKAEKEVYDLVADRTAAQIDAAHDKWKERDYG